MKLVFNKVPNDNNYSYNCNINNNSNTTKIHANRMHSTDYSFFFAFVCR